MFFYDYFSEFGVLLFAFSIILLLLSIPEGTFFCSSFCILKRDVRAACFLKRDVRAACFLKRDVRAACFLKRDVRLTSFWQNSQNANFHQKIVQFRGGQIWPNVVHKKKKNDI